MHEGDHGSGEVMNVFERIDGYYPGKSVLLSRVATAQLKALAESHERLLDEVKFVRKADPLISRLNSAIEQAERLTSHHIPQSGI